MLRGADLDGDGLVNYEGLSPFPHPTFFAIHLINVAVNSDFLKVG
jgi:hypothetical protein